MSHNLDDSVAVHALNALPDAERVIVEAALDFDDNLASEYDIHREVAAELVEGFSDVVPAPSPQLWDRIAQAAGLGAAVPDEPLDTTETLALPRWRRMMPALIGVAALLLAVALAASLLTRRAGGSGLDAMAAAAADLPGSLTVTLADPAGGGPAADAVIEPTGTGFVNGEQLPTLSEGRTYQLWAIVEDRVVSVGLLGNRPSTSAFRVEGQLTGLAITEEVLGGVVASESDPVAVWLQEA